MGEEAGTRMQQFLQQNASLVGAGALTLAGVTAASVYYNAVRPKPLAAPLDMQNQSILMDGKERARASGFLASDPHTLMTYLYDDTTTTYEAFLRGLRVSNNGNCLGNRSAPGKPYEWITYKQVLDKAHNFGSGLITKGVVASNSTFVGIYSGNCIEWAVADLGCQMFSMVPVPLYDTLGPEACKYIINQTELCTIVCDDSAKALKLLTEKGQLASLKRLVFIGTTLPDDLQQAAESCNVDLLLFKDVELLGQNNRQEPKPPKPDDLATLCYTSGTTGDPKGVMLTHANFLILLSAVHLQESSVLTLQPKDVHLSYLPLAHMFERGMHIIVFMCGASIGYFSGDIRKLTEDLMELRPSIFPTVPRLLNRIFDKVQAGVSGSWFKSLLFKLALHCKMREVKMGIVRNDSIWDKLVFGKIQKLLGGRVRIIVTGSAPLAPSVLDFVRCAFGCLVCCKGGNVMKGYYRNPEKTAEALDNEGWLHTGDIGMWLPNGTLKIIDRKKNIFKLAQGEYVAVEKVENIYLKSRFVGQCFVEGDSLKPSLMAVVVPDEEVVKPFAENNGLPTDLVQFCKSEKAKEIILKDMLSKAKGDHLKGFEQAKDIHLHPELFTVESGLLTPTMKNKRPALRKFFKQTVENLYKKHQL